MLDGGGGGSGGPGSSNLVIAAAAAESELVHEGWEDIGGGRVKKDFGYGAMSHVQTTVTIDTWTGEWESETLYGEVPDSVLQGYVGSAKRIIDKWPPKIEGLFEKWVDIPHGYEISSSAIGLEHAVGELRIDADNPEAQGSDLSPANTRLAGDITRLTTRTAQLSGTYARKFSDYYVNDLPATIESQDMLLATLSVGANAQGKIWECAYADAVDLGTKAHAAMLKARPSENTDGLIMVLTVVGALAGAVSAVPTLGGSAVVIAALGGATAIGAAYADASKKEEAKVELGAEHPDKVYTNLKNALDKLDKKIEEQEQGLADWLSAGKRLADSGSCDLKDPAMNTAPSGEVLSKEQDVVVTPGVIAEITEMWLPSVAGDLRQAEKELVVTKSEGFHRSTDVGLAPDGAWPEFSALQTRASEILTDMAKDLDKAAESLQDAARIIGLADESQFDTYEKKAKKVQDQNINDSDDVPA